MTLYLSTVPQIKVFDLEHVKTKLTKTENKSKNINLSINKWANL